MRSNNCRSNLVYISAVLFCCLPIVVSVACGGGGGSSSDATSTPQPFSNYVPVISTLEAQNLVDSKPFSIKITAEDLGGEALSYILLEAPEGMTIDQTGTISWTPVNQIGTFEVQVQVSDASGFSDIKKFSVSVISPSDNTAPTITSPGVLSATAGQPFSHQMLAEDVHTPLTFSLSSGPAGLLMSEAGLITWTPESSQGGAMQSVYFSVSDRYGLSSSGTISITVSNTAPVITGLATQSATLATEFTVSVSAIDNNTPLTYAISTGPAGMTINATTGLISWTPTNAYAGLTVSTTVTVTDKLGEYSEMTFATQVSNLPPQVSAISDQTISVAATFSVTVDATDPNTPLVYSLETAPAGMTIDAATGAISWTPDTVGGPHEVVARVTDSFGDETDVTFNLTVNNVSPVIDAIANQTTAVGAAFSLQVNASDSNTPLTYTLTGGAPAGMTINSSTGLISWTPPATEEGKSYSNIQIKVIDSLAEFSTANFNITVTNVAPVVGNIPAQNTTVSIPYNYDVGATASDNQVPLLYQLSNQPSGMTIDGNGLISWTPAHSFENQTINNITVTVTDSHATDPKSTVKTFSITLPNSAPAITAIPDQDIATGSSVSMDLSNLVYDTDTPITFQLSPAPNVGANPAPSINGTTGVMTWSPNTIGGPYVFTLKTTDQQAASNSVAFNITVTAVNNLPSVAITSPSGRQSGQISINYTLTDADANLCAITVEYSLNGGAGPWSAATEGIGSDGSASLISSPGGTAHTFVWDSATDSIGVTYPYKHDVQIRITPNDGIADGGTVNSTSFKVDNIPGGTFVALNNMNVTRRSHLAVRLADGKVLLAGGFNGSVQIANSDIFDPATGVYTATAGNMVTGRYYAWGLLIQSGPNAGKVVLAGGYTTTYIRSAELFDPVAGTFAQITADIGYYSGYLGTASYLPNDNKILFCGGYSGSNRAEARIYDPDSGALGTFSATGSMTTGRSHIPAKSILLGNGKVFIAGSYSTTESTEFYDQTAGTFSAGPNLLSAGFYHDLALLDDGKVLIAGMRYSNTYSATCQMYNPADNTIYYVGDMTSIRGVPPFTAKLPDGRVLAAGGHNGSDANNSAEIFDPTTRTWTAISNMNASRHWHGMTILDDGKILITGGSNNASHLNTTEIYIP